MKSPTSRATIWLLILLLAAFMAACQSDQAQRIVLSEQDQAAAIDSLYPRFDLAHAAPIELQPELQQLMDGVLDNLAAQFLPDAAERPFTLVVTAEPDADAGCIAGGRLFVSKGLLSWIENADEMAGVLAIALHQCAAASQSWRQRDRQQLVAFEENSELMTRYIDYRLNANASLFNQAVLRGCGSADCSSVVQPLLEAAGYQPAALSTLAGQLQQAWPLAPWLERTGIDGSIAANEENRIDPEWARLLIDHYNNRFGYERFAEVRRQISLGELILAYRASLDAMRELGRTYETSLLQAELDLHNLHPYYSERIFRRIEADHGEIIHGDYYWGWAHAQLKRRDQAIEMLNNSIEILPKVSAHHFLGQQYILENNLDLADQHLNHVLEAGPSHPYSADAEMFLDIVDKRRP